MKTFWIVRESCFDPMRTWPDAGYRVYKKKPRRRKRGSPFVSMWLGQLILTLCAHQVHAMTPVRLKAGDEPVEVRLVLVKKRGK